MTQGTKFTVVMPSYLGAYKTAAKNRDVKIHRAINSVLGQTYSNWELIIIADGCQKSLDIIKDYMRKDERVRGYYIERDSLWSGSPRNTGIEYAKGDYIIYLDIDDEYRSMYLDDIAFEIEKDKLDWYWVDDIVYDKKNGYILRESNITKIGMCGTSNVIHKPNVYWPPKGTYAHDYTFINSLKASSDNKRKLDALGYVVQHIPNRYDM